MDKTCSAWCEPTFQGIWLVQVRESGVTNPPKLVQHLRSPFSKLSRALVALANLAQPLVYLGALLFLLLAGRETRLVHLLGLIALLGGFLFHTVCETKAQYTLPYFVMLLPYAVYGFGRWARALASAPSRIKVEGWRALLKPRVAAFAAVAVLTAAFLLIPALNNRYVSRVSAEDTAAYTQTREAILGP